MTKSEEREVLIVYDNWLHSYLNGDVNTYDSFLDDDYHFIGSTNNEDFLNRKDTTKFFAETADQFAGKTELKNNRRIIEKFDDLIFITELFDGYFLIGNEWKYYSKFRFTSILRKNKEGWRFIYQHFSTPDSKAQAGETIGTEQIAAENLMLREAIRRRTIELEQRNRELEIEASLERIRTMAMGMMKPEDLAGIGANIFKELKALGFANLRNTEIIINHDEKGTITSYYYSDYGVTGVIELKYNSNPVIKEWAEKLKKADDAFAEVVITEDEMDAWRKFREEIGYLPDSKLNKTKTVYYYSYSTGLGALSISSFKPVTGEDIKILERFRNVFQLAYQRYIDIALAKAQAREAQIEAVLEKVRSRSLAMHKADDLQEVVTVVVEKLMELGVILDSNGVTLCTYFNNSKDVLHWIASPDVSFSGSYLLPYFDHIIFNDAWESKNRGDDYFSKTYTKEEKDSFFEYAFENSDYRNFPDEFKEWIFQNDKHTLSFAWANNSAILIPSNTGIQPSDDDIEILKRFARVFEQANIRFMDLQKAEAQARDAQIEIAVERVRAKALAMHKSEEILEVVVTLKNELMGLDISGVAAATIHLEEEDGFVRMWDLSSVVEMEEGFQLALDVKFRLEETDPDFYVRKVWDNDNKYFVVKQEEEDLVRTVEWLRQYQPEMADEVLKFLDANKVKYLLHPTVKLAKGRLSADLLESVPDEIESILTKMGAAFDLAYKRFGDLKKAEAQTREARIEGALERTRTQSMLMQNSDELNDTVRVFHEQLEWLEIVSEFSYIWLPDEEKGNHLFWATWNEVENDTTIYKNRAVTYPLDKSEPSIAACYLAWESGEPIHVNPVAPSDVENYFATWSELLSGIEKFRPEHFKEGLYYVDAYMKYGCFGIVIKRPLTEEEEKTLERFGTEFERAYSRFIDLQKAEEQAREAQIEASLERIRGRAMAMTESADLLDIVVTMRKEFVSLGHEAYYFWHMRWLPDKYEKAMTSVDGTRIGMVMELPRGFHEDQRMIDWETTTEPVGIFTYDGEGAVDYVDKMISTGRFHEIDHNAPGPDDIRAIGGLTFVMARTTHGEIGYSLPGMVSDPPEDDLSTLVRFAGVFDLAYRRFEDLKKAERQARETEIELALERVRSRTMAMHSSDELKEVIQLVYDQFVNLEIQIEHAGFIMDYKARDDMYIWLADKHEVPFQVTIPYFDCAHWNSFNEAKEKGINFFANHLSFEEKNKFYQDLFQHIPGIPEDTFEFYLTCPGLAISTVLLENVGLYIENFSGIPFSEEENATLMRFGNVFQQTYTRFLDLQKAEAQAREAQIEAALERVRARTMAMHQSAELGDVAAELFAQMNQLVTNLWTCGFVLCEKDRDEDEWWLSMDTGFTRGFFLPNVGDYAHATLYEGWLKRDTFRTVQLEGEALQEHYDWLMGISVSRKIFEEMDAAGLERPDWQKLHAAYFSRGYLVLITRETCDEEEIFKRFAQVFDLIYTRFLDLQKAEAQAREANKQASLDRVRGEIASMRYAKDLEIITPLVWNELTTLDIPFIRCGVFIIHEEVEKVAVYLSNPEGESLAVMHLSFDSDDLVVQTVNAWRKGNVYKQHWTREEFLSWGRSMVEQGHIPDLGTYQGAKEAPESLDLHFVPFNQGMLYVGATEPLSDEEIDLSASLAEAFSIAYSRYEDFVKLEKAKENIEAALTELKATQSQLIQQEKLASLGQLTAGIAHEIKNPLNFVNNFSELSRELLDELLEELEKGNTVSVKSISDDIKANLDKIHEHGTRADSIVKSMLMHSRGGSGQKEPTDINELIREYVNLTFHGMRAGKHPISVQIDLKLDETLDPVPVIVEDLSRVIINLCNNAFDAMRSKLLDPSQKSGYTPKLTVRTKRNANRAIIEIEDNGPGIPEEMKDKILQPFFTTKKGTEGTGLGLSITNDIVKAHGGEISINTNENEGTEFTVALPV